jgi:hypothetical protein
LIKRALAFALAAPLLTACAAGGVLSDGASLALESDPYRVVLQRWTKQQKVYRHFAAKIFVTSTYFSPELREAYILRRARVLGLPEARVRLLRDQHSRDAERYHEFLVSVYTGDRRWNDLDDAESMWRITLSNDRGNEVSPVAVEREDARHGDLTAYFPYITVFQKAYIVRFPRVILEMNAPLLGADVNAFSMRFLSGVAVAELKWDLNAPAVAKAEAP